MITTPSLETPALPEGYFFRVTGPAKNAWGDRKKELVNVQLRVRGWFGLSISAYDENALAIPDSIHRAMRALAARLSVEEEEDRRRLQIRKLYGDYPPKKL